MDQNNEERKLEIAKINEGLEKTNKSLRKINEEIKENKDCLLYTSRCV